MPDSGANERPGEMKANYHSRYAPETEASRHLDTSLAGKRPALLFILGAGRNYLGQLIRQRLPDAMVVVLQASTDFDTDLVDPGDLYWSPGSHYPLESILNSALASGKAAGGVAIIEWPPAARTCKAELESIRGSLRLALEKYSSESATAAYWGKRWLRNCIDFVCGEGPLALPIAASGPLVIACAGPGLPDAIPAIREAGSGVQVWALASAHQTLLSYGIEPEVLISTDPGFWNAAHLAVAARRKTVLLATPSTRIGSAILDGMTAIAPVCTGLGFEVDALAAAGDIPALEALPSGTVAGTAVSIATTLGACPIYLCGLDLAAHGLSEHAYPYAFDLLDETGETRLHSVLTARFHRIMDRYPDSIGKWRLSRAFSAYALDTASLADKDTVIRISSSPVETGLKRAAPEVIRDSLRTEPAVPQTGKRNAAEEVQTFMRRHSRVARRQAMMERLDHRATMALAVLKECVATNRPVPRDTVLELLAFGGKGCAAAIATAARGETIEAEFKEAEQAVRQGLWNLAGGNA
ncbi:MAG: 6-hydroxymethylpterin diphosphokinase MptE-like protein [Clostridia bacterium]